MSASGGVQLSGMDFKKTTDKNSKSKNENWSKRHFEEPPRLAISATAVFGFVCNVSFWLCVFFMVLVQGNDGEVTVNTRELLAIQDNTGVIPSWVFFVTGKKIQ